MSMPLLLSGLNGGNPLAFLAALGAFRTTALMWPAQNVRMHWSSAQGSWHPHLTLAREVDRDDWLTALAETLTICTVCAVLAKYKDLTVLCSDFRKAAEDAASQALPGDRGQADFLAAFGSEAIESEANGKKTGLIADTALRTMSGAGHQHFLVFMRDLAKAKVTEIGHLRHALFEIWRYADPGPSMRWDPVDDRRYALRWRQPSGDPVTAVRGANRLAIEALPLLPTAPVRARLETTGFTQRKGRGVIWTWPIWTVPVPLDVVRSLLSLPQLQADEPDRRNLSAQGIAEVYRCQRITQGKYRNFTPAHPA